MNCEATRELIGSYLDEELGAGLGNELREHLAGCRGCAEAYSQLGQLRSDIRIDATHYQAPAAFVDSLREALRREAAHEKSAIIPPAGWRWAAIAASVLLVLSLAWNVVGLRSRNPDGGAVEEAVLSSHVRSLMGSHLLDVPSSDQHTVKPWFNGKLDFSPDVKDFAGDGYPLIGGRVDYLSGRPVAALVYHRRQHVLNLFIWPATQSDRAGQWTERGFHVVRWQAAGMDYCAVSDIPLAEVQDFERLYRQ